MYAPEVARFSAAIKHSVAYDTALHKWPTVLTHVVDVLFRECNLLSQSSTESEKAQEGKAIIEKLSAIKYELTHDRPLKPLEVPAPRSQASDTFCAPTSEPYDTWITQTKPTWFHSDSLFTECYLYRYLRNIFESSIQWKNYDPFESSKMESLRASGSVFQLCAMWMEKLHQESNKCNANALESKALFRKILLSSLLGRETNASHIIVDDFESLWKNIRRLQNDRVDIVLGDAGSELLAAFLISDFLLSLRGPIPRATRERADELHGRVESVRSRVTQACKAAGVRSEPRLLAVSKLHPPSDLMAVYERTGQRHFGENYVQELVEKAAVLPDDIQWHFIGGLQSNKAKILAAVPNLYAVQSLDSEKLATGLEKALAKTENASRRNEPLYVYVQVNTSGEEGKSGVPAMGSAWTIGQEKPVLLQLAEKIMLGCPHLRLRGLMTIGALANSRVAGDTHQNPDFERLSQSRKFLMDALRSDTDFQAKLHKTRWWTPTGDVTDAYMLESENEFGLSMGMSADMEAAVALGSTEVRVGSDCFGPRTSNHEAGDVRAAEIAAHSTQPLVREVVFHTKNMPWFVNNACAKDIPIMLEKLSEDGLFTADQGLMESVHTMAKRWKSHFHQGHFRLQVPSNVPLGASTGAFNDFWTWPDSYGAMPERAAALLTELQKAGLVLFQGDLNYRKLTQDAQWPSDTSFAHALGPLYGTMNLAVLRNCQSEACVGLEPGQADELARQDPDWHTNGRWASNHAVVKFQWSNTPLPPISIIARDSPGY